MAVLAVLGVTAVREGKVRQGRRPAFTIPTAVAVAAAVTVVAVVEGEILLAYW